MYEGGVSFIVFSDDWARHPSSSQHIFRIISQKNRVLWVNTIGLRRPRLDSFTLRRGLEKISSWLSPVKRVSDNLYVVDLPSIPFIAGSFLATLSARFSSFFINSLAKRLEIERPIIWASVPNAADYIDFLDYSLDYSYLIYYPTDDYAHWPGADAERIKGLDRILSLRSDLILPVSSELAKRYPSYKTHILQHGVDFNHFSRDFSLEDEPAELKGIRHPRVCFFGLIYEKIDLDLVEYLARKRQDISFVLIGPRAGNVDLSSLNRCENVYLLGSRNYRDLPRYLFFMDAFILPYLKDEFISKSSPLKLKESLAVGRPVLAVRIPDLVEHSRGLNEGLYLYDDKEDALCLIDRVLDVASYVPRLAERLREYVRPYSWECVVDNIFELIDNIPRVNVIRTVSREEKITRSCLGPYLSWCNVFKNSYNMQPVIIHLRDSLERECGFPFVLQRSLLPGRLKLVGLPYLDCILDYAFLHGQIRKIESSSSEEGFCYSSAVIAALLRMLLRLKYKWCLESVEIRSAVPLLVDEVSLFEKVDRKVFFALKLKETADLQWKEFSPKVRNLIRKAERYPLSVVRMKKEGLDAFYRVYFETMRRHASPPHSKDFFRTLFDEFEDQASTFVVFYDKANDFHQDSRGGGYHCETNRERKEDSRKNTAKAIAAGLTIVDDLGVWVPWAGSLLEYKHTSANMLLYWEMIKYGIERGAMYFNFGRSDRLSGTYQFKKQWGGQEYSLLWYYYPKGSCFERGAFAVQLAQSLWRLLPDRIIESIGPFLISRLS